MPAPTPDPEPASLWVRDGDTVGATSLSTGPWAADALHGGPVAALLAHELSAPPDGGAPAFFPARLTLELWRPVGFGPHRVEVRTVRAGRRVRVVEAVLSRAERDGAAAGDDVVARATLQQITAEPLDLGGTEPAMGTPTPPPPPEACVRADLRKVGDPSGDGGRFHDTAVEHRSPGPSFLGLGPAVDWIRVGTDLLPGVPLSPFERVVAAADFGNGVSGALPFDRFVYVNPDLTVHLFRLPVDEWVALDAVTRLDPTGASGHVGMAESLLWDRRGPLGRSVQSLYLGSR